MRAFEVAPETGGQSLEDVRQAAAFLKGQACTFAARNINTGLSRLQFNREVAYFAQGIVQDAESGAKGIKGALRELKQSAAALARKSVDISIKTAGIAAGVAQIGAAYGTCRLSGGLLCSTVGMGFAAHGLNNIYENTSNLITGRSDAEGMVRQGYQKLATYTGGTKADGNIMYGVADIGLSIFGLAQLIPKPDTWRLWYHGRQDFLRNYQTATRAALAFEAFINSVTLEAIYREQKNKDSAND